MDFESAVSARNCPVFGKVLFSRVVFIVYRLACMKCPRIARLSSLIMPSRLVAGLPCPVYGRSVDWPSVFQPLCHVPCKPQILSVSTTQLDLSYRFSSAQSLHSFHSLYPNATFFPSYVTNSPLPSRHTRSQELELPL